MNTRCRSILLGIGWLSWVGSGCYMVLVDGIALAPFWWAMWLVGLVIATGLKITFDGIEMG